jgi:hypothetical protein
LAIFGMSIRDHVRHGPFGDETWQLYTPPFCVGSFPRFVAWSAKTLVAYIHCFLALHPVFYFYIVLQCILIL